VITLGNLEINVDSSIGKNTLTPGERPYAVITGGTFDYWTGNIYPHNENIFAGSGIPSICPNGVTGTAGKCTPQYLVNRVRNHCDEHDYWSELFGLFAPPSQSNCLSWSFAKAYAYYKSVQTFWASHKANCISELRTEWGGLTLIITAAVQNLHRYYITIPQEVFNQLNNFQLLGFPEDAEFIVTLPFNSDVTITSKGKWPTLVGAFPGRVVFNIVSNHKVVISETRLPSVLAPDATIVQESGRVEGFLIARNVPYVGTVYTVDCNLGAGQRRLRDRRSAVEVAI